MATKKTGLAESSVEESPEITTAEVMEESQTYRPLDYIALCAPFDKTFKRPLPGGAVLDYITREQVTTRLNEVVKPENWDWEVNRTEIIEDEVIVRGSLTIRNYLTDGIYSGCRESIKSGSGGSKIKRKRDGTTLSIGNDTKAAEADAFKKAAMAFGVGLYLAERTGEGEAELPTYTPASTSPYTQTPNMAALPPVSFPQGSGTSVTGVIEQVSMPGLGPDGKQRLGGVKIQNTWYNASKFNPVDLGAFKEGMAVTVQHPAGKTFIDGIQAVNQVVNVGDVEQEEALAF